MVIWVAQGQVAVMRSRRRRPPRARRPFGRGGGAGPAADSEILQALRNLPEEFWVAMYLADIEGYWYPSWATFSL